MSKTENSLISEGRLLTHSAHRQIANKGFALVVTLSMMILLVVIAVSMLSLSAISLRSATADDEMIEARSNARMGLMIAIGELQRSLGADQRISSRALTLAQDERIGASVEPSSPRAWWVGAAGSNTAFGMDGSTEVTTTNPAAVWFVSGLDPAASAGEQLNTEFDYPVIMFDEYSIGTSMTGGQPLEAGIVRVTGSKQNRVGGYAYFVDDEGMKAAVAPSDSRLVNTDEPESRSDLTPGAYDVSMLAGMEALEGTPLSAYTKIMSIGDLALIGGSKELAADKRLSFTTYSRGVLCDVKQGGLKRDLTVAFEDDVTFSEVFPPGTYGEYTTDYLCLDPDKLEASPELQENGYIHWEIFKDFYNIKRHIKTAADGSTKYLDPVRYTKDGPFLNYTFNGTVNPRPDPLGAGGYKGSLFMAGRLGPHEIGDDEFFHTNNQGQFPYREMIGMPFGDYQVEPSNPRTSKNHAEFKHSPVMPVLQRFQANAWMESLNSSTIRTHAQMWSSHYNPYNISLFVAGNSGGPRVLGAPSIRPTSSALRSATRRFATLHENQNATGDRQSIGYLENVDMNGYKFEFHAEEMVMLLPGRSHVLAYKEDRQIGVDSIQDGFLYSEKVKDLTVQSVYRDIQYVSRNPSTGQWDVPEDLPASFDLTINMFLMNASMSHGVDDNNGGPGNFELHQTFWAPFAWEKVDTMGGKPGVSFDLGMVSASTLNENKMASLGFNLRTTREADGIRPLVDANIRCVFGNSRWDSPLDLPLLAAYTPENNGIMDEMVMQMATQDDPKGYTYWGSGREPSYGYDRVVLFDIPRSDLVSLGQLQHASAGRFSYEPTYIVGNSYANPRISQTNWKESITDNYSTDARGLARYPILDSFNLYDASYLVNEVMWDGYTFTTIPQVADNVSPLVEATPDAAHYEAIASGDVSLPNARYIPYEPIGSSFDMETLKMESNRLEQTGAFYHNAGHLLVDGAFNVNSTSADAWEAFLTSTHMLPVEKLNSNGEIVGYDDKLEGVRFPRVQTVFGEGAAKNEMDENFWTGYRNLNQEEVRELAVAMASEVQKRGPFLTMGEFVNRKLEDGELGEKGALQAALDATVNDGLDSEYGRDEQATGFPGQLLQGDVLQALAPYMTVRSDVFTIRAYGESVNATTGNVLARAWCEAKVQRFPDPIDWGNSSDEALKELANPSSPFGRKFRMISFRWLNPNEI